MRFDGTPVIPVRGGVVFPKQIIPVRFFRDVARRALEAARASDTELGLVLLAVQRDSDQEQPSTTAAITP